jgi:hypothetical protein
MRTGLHAGLREMTGFGLVDAARAPGAERDLHGGIAVGRGRFDLCDAVVGHIQHGHRDGSSVIGKHARHAHFPPE